MKKLVRKLFVLFLVLTCSVPMLAVGDDGAQDSEEDTIVPSLLNTLINTVSSLKRSQTTSLDKIKTIIRQVQLQFFPPDLEGNKEGINGDGISPGGKMKDAAERSFKSGKATVEESAKTAANVVRGAIHKTEQKESPKAKERPRNDL
ncbi:uncharacterized protein LOC110808375 isoform X2 [Carica papaya]|uniref:uncharacterized protein LOC110808375 isoform X2 n=1 Tax=Carica papaya TaxID=3649 RepID=UPI000B8C9C02|nr:uncharacterized protein LOC110808375 isoform X2 [Carica papaya]